MSSLSRDDYIILSVPWKVCEIPAGDARIDDALGKADFNNYVIWLNADIPYRARLEILLHETIHILVEGRDKVDLVQEDMVHVFSQVLYDTLSRNGLNFGPTD